jgi:hypothetical protein
VGAAKGQVVTLAYRCSAAIAEVLRARPDTELLPTRLAQACVAAVPVDGAGISITHDVRLPLGASDATAASAEQLQSTLGEGPCLDASRTNRPSVADWATMAQRWPTFHTELLAQTPFRSIISLPLRGPDHCRFGAIDLYSTHPTATPRAALAELVEHLAAPISSLLLHAPAGPVDDRISIPLWLFSEPAASRMRVWTAIGVVQASSALDAPTILAVLRGYAYSHATTLDDVAQMITTKQLAPDRVIG